VGAGFDAAELAAAGGGEVGEGEVRPLLRRSAQSLPRWGFRV